MSLSGRALGSRLGLSSSLDLTSRSLCTGLRFAGCTFCSNDLYTARVRAVARHLGGSCLCLACNLLRPLCTLLSFSEVSGGQFLALSSLLSDPLCPSLGLTNTLLDLRLSCTRFSSLQSCRLRIGRRYDPSADSFVSSCFRCRCPLFGASPCNHSLRSRIAGDFEPPVGLLELCLNLSCFGLSPASFTFRGDSRRASLVDCPPSICCDLTEPLDLLAGTLTTLTDRPLRCSFGFSASSFGPA